MSTIKDKSFLIKVHKLLHDIQDTRQILQLNEKQKINIQQAREEYNAGRHKSTDELFDGLLNERFDNF